MTNLITDSRLQPEHMPAALLAELFAGGIVVIPEEFEAVAAPVGKASEAVTVSTETAATPSWQGLKAEDGPQQIAPAANLTWLGNFGKRILVVVNDPTALHINERDFEFLGKILASVKLSMADIALVNAATHALEYYTLNEKLPAAVAFYFGIQPVDIGAPIKFPYFQVQSWNHTRFVYAPTLAELSAPVPQAVELKKELWAALKKIFG